MATIKKPVSKMQTGGKVKIKVKIKPDRKQAREDKNKAPLMTNPLNDAQWKKKEFEFDAAKEAATKAKGMKKGGVIKKAKSGGSFPDLNKDGKITKADILKGRGVIAKKGAAVKKKKMQYGGAAASMVPPMMKKGGATKKCKYGCK